MNALINVFACFGFLVVALAAVVALVAFADWLGDWKRRLVDHKAASVLEREIEELKAKLAIATEGGPYRSAEPSGTDTRNEKER